jgi:hypothetical protein
MLLSDRAMCCVVDARQQNRAALLAQPQHRPPFNAVANRTESGKVGAAPQHL